jgi:hypothetical protein
VLADRASPSCAGLQWRALAAIARDEGKHAGLALPRRSARRGQVAALGPRRADDANELPTLTGSPATLL